MSPAVGRSQEIKQVRLLHLLDPRRLGKQEDQRAAGLREANHLENQPCIVKTCGMAHCTSLQTSESALSPTLALQKVFSSLFKEQVSSGHHDILFQ
jgi:hypothetical protein